MIVIVLVIVRIVVISDDTSKARLVILKKWDISKSSIHHCIKINININFIGICSGRSTYGDESIFFIW